MKPSRQAALDSFLRTNMDLLVLSNTIISRNENERSPSPSHEMPSSVPITVAIPTYGRDQVLVDTIRHVLALVPPPAEVLVLDQTRERIPGVVRTLEEWLRSGAIRWICLPEPLIPGAMN